MLTNPALVGDPRGLTLTGARVTGALDLENATLTYPLAFHWCFFTDAPNVEAATLPRLSFAGSHLPGLRADGLQLRYEFTLDNLTSTGGVRVLGASIGGQLSMNGATLDNPDGNTLYLDGATIAGDLFADEGFTSTGQIRALGASIGGQLVLTGAKLHNPDGDTLYLDGATIAGGLFADEGFTSTGQIRALGASIGGQLVLTGAKLHNPDGDTLTLDGATITGGLFADEGFTSTGQIRALGASIGGQLSMNGATLDNPDGNTLYLDGATIAGDLFADEGFTSTGQIRALGASIGGQLVLTGAKLHNPDGDTLYLDGATIAGGLFADEGFTSTGQIRALGASIGGQLDLTGATLDNPDGNTLYLDRATITGGLFADEGFTSTGQIRALGASIGGQLSMNGATLDNPDGNTLYLDGATIAGGLFADEGFTSTGQIRAPGASIGAQLVLTGATLDNPDGNVLDLEGGEVGGLVLAELSRSRGTLDLTACQIGDLILDDGDNVPAPPPLSSATGWRVRDVHGAMRSDRGGAAAWLRTAALFTAQPWEELARVYDRNGQPVDARRLRFEAAYRSMWTNRHHKSATVARLGYGLTVGFGYYPLVAAVWLVLFLGGAWGLTAANSDQFVPTVTTARATIPGAPGTAPTPPLGCPSLTQPLTAATDAHCRTAGYPDLDPLPYALATVTPAGALTAPAWTPTPGATGLNATLTAFKLAGWLMTAFLLAGLTGLLRKG